MCSFAPFVTHLQYTQLGKLGDGRVGCGVNGVSMLFFWPSHGSVVQDALFSERNTRRRGKGASEWLWLGMKKFTQFGMLGILLLL